MRTADEMFKELGYIEHFNTEYAEVFRKDSTRSSRRQIAFNQKTKSIINENYISMKELQAINEKVKELGWNEKI